MDLNDWFPLYISAVSRGPPANLMTPCFPLYAFVYFMLDGNWEGRGRQIAGAPLYHLWSFPPARGGPEESEPRSFDTAMCATHQVCHHLAPTPWFPFPTKSSSPFSLLALYHSSPRCSKTENHQSFIRKKIEREDSTELKFRAWRAGLKPKFMHLTNWAHWSGELSC